MRGADRGDQGRYLFRQIVDEHVAKPHIGTHAKLFGCGLRHRGRHTVFAQGFGNFFHFGGAARGMQRDPAEVVPRLATPVETGKALAGALSAAAPARNIGTRLPYGGPLDITAASA